MSALIIRWCVNALSLMLVGVILPGIEIKGVLWAFLAAALLGVMNTFVRPLLILITLPLSILTLGLFTLVINGFILLVVGSLIEGVEVRGMGWAVLGALTLGLINWAMTSLMRGRGELGVIDLQKGTNGTWKA
jgi:putative membrane protein